MKKTITLFTCLLAGLHYLQPVAAVEIDDADPDLGGFSADAGYKFKEGKVTIPPFPDEDKLIKVEMDRAIGPFTYYIDPDTLTVGEDDVVRYTVVIKSSSGALNVLYEGLRCSATEYRTYAYGTSDGKMSKATVSEWTRIYNTGSLSHRYNFYQYYMCDKKQLPYRRDIALQRIRYPDDFNTGADNADW